ncbi:hypothetical protein CSA_021609 [Cucumis sativus]|uniref:Uncharacterized protein n=1 Tax=Cucumis sativus TaxID=3659 RepID=A0ACB6HC05_CUCSA|nr:hypothetical protein CSA_021609 [Cucumis sativus]
MKEIQNQVEVKKQSGCETSCRLRVKGRNLSCPGSRPSVGCSIVWTPSNWTFVLTSTDLYG